MTSAQSRLHDWADVILADFQTVISRYLHKISTYLFCEAERIFRTIIMQNCTLIQAYFLENHLGLNRPILCPLWLVTSAAADVISVSSVNIGEKAKSVTTEIHVEIFYEMNNLIIKLIACRFGSKDFRVGPVQDIYSAEETNGLFQYERCHRALEGVLNVGDIIRSLFSLHGNIDYHSIRERFGLSFASWYMSTWWSI